LDKTEAELLEDGRVVLSQNFDDEQDALNWLWQQAELADENAGELSGCIGGKPVKL
jgi:hypothetical protein